jgi:hypothetical protein
LVKKQSLGVRAGNLTTGIAPMKEK